jgi:hypothetical protein
MQRSNHHATCSDTDRELRAQIRALSEEERKENQEDKAPRPPPPDPLNSKTRSLGTSSGDPFKRDFKAKVQAEIERVQKHQREHRVEIKNQLGSRETEILAGIASLTKQRDEGLTEDEWETEYRLWRRENRNSPYYNVMPYDMKNDPLWREGVQKEWDEEQRRDSQEAEKISAKKKADLDKEMAPERAEEARLKDERRKAAERAEKDKAKVKAGEWERVLEAMNERGRIQAKLDEIADRARPEDERRKTARRAAKQKTQVEAREWEGGLLEAVKARVSHQARHAASDPRPSE